MSLELKALIQPSIDLLRQQGEDSLAATKACVRGFKQVTEQMKDFDARLSDAEQKAARRGGGGGSSGGLEFSGGPSLGAQVANSSAMNEFKAAGYRGTSRLETKATITTANVTGVRGGLILPGQAGVETEVRRPLTIRSLCRVLQTGSNQVVMMVQDGRNNAAAVAPEGSWKGEGSLAYVEKSFKVATIATWLPVTRQAIDDAAGLASLIDTELRGNLAEREEDGLLYGNGVGDNLTGLMPQATAFAAPFEITNATPFDRLLQALAQVSTGNFKPSAIVLNTADAFRLHSIKDTAGRYIGGGPYEGLVNLLWTIPWVASNGLAPNDFLIGDFTKAEIYDRMDAEVLITDSHADFFAKNLYAIRAEQRLAFVVRDARAFVKGHLIDPA